jgi:hypothetical protein
MSRRNGDSTHPRAIDQRASGADPSDFISKRHSPASIVRWPDGLPSARKLGRILGDAFGRGRGPTTGTVNPGILWAGRTMQLGFEAVIPINHQTGSRVGWLVQVHFFLDDLFPTSIGKPIFGK